MKKSSIQAISFLLIAVLILSACSSKSTTDSTASVAPQTSGGQTKSDKPITLSAFISQNAALESVENAPFTKEAEKVNNIKFNWVIAPPGDTGDKRNLVLASGDYPEIFLSGNFTPDEQVKYGKQGVLLPLNDLIAQYAPNVTKAFADNPYIKDAITTPDGNIYALPQVNECYHCWFAQKFWINKGWLDNLGMAMPTTTDEFEAVLKAFKEKDPNGNKKKDEVPLSGALNNWHMDVTGFLMNAFIYNTGDDQAYSYLRVKDGKVETSANQPEWKDGLVYMNKLYKEGLIDNQSFTQNIEGAQQLGNNSGAEILGTFAAGHLGMVINHPEGDKRNTDYTALAPLKGPNGVQLSGYYRSVGSPGRFAITNKASEEKQIAAIKLVDYLWSKEGTWGQVFGVKGSVWDDADPGQLDFNGKQADIQVNAEWFAQQTHSDSWEQAGPDYRPRDRFESQAVSQDIFSNDGYELRLVQETKKYDGLQPKDGEFFPMDIFMDAADSDKAVQLKKAIQDYIKTNMVQFITGAKDINKEWDSYMTGFNGLKLNDYLTILQKAYDANLKK